MRGQEPITLAELAEALQRFARDVPMFHVEIGMPAPKWGGCPQRSSAEHAGTSRQQYVLRDRCDRRAECSGDGVAGATHGIGRWDSVACLPAHRNSFWRRRVRSADMSERHASDFTTGLTMTGGA